MFVEQLESRFCLAGLVAFPGAEGFGRFAQGGRGGDVYHVQNLNDNGPGSFREGISTANGPRTVVFDVSGTIFLESDIRISRPHITIAGETAPGGGITFAGDRFSIQNTHDVIVRYIRSRPGDILGDMQSPVSRDAFNVFHSTDVILDHVSGSWATDEVFALTGPGDVTIQWSTAAEGLNRSFHPNGAHSNASLNINGNLSFHHNLLISNLSRNPKIQQVGDVVNNVVYNFGIGSLIGLFGGDDRLGPTQVNLEGNYFIAGGDTSGGSISRERMVRLFEESEIWTQENYVDFDRDGILNGSLATDANIEFHDSDSSPEGIVVANRFDYPRVTTTDAPTAYDQVLRRAGASLVRDAVDLRLVDEVMNQTGQLIDSQDEVGGWPVLDSGEVPLDSDQDGMPDDWELINDLDPQDPEDRNQDNDADGYTELEEYLHTLASGVQHAQSAGAGDHAAPVVAINAPNGGENWHIGSVEDIVWSTGDNVGVTSLDLYYSTSGAAGPFRIIALGEANDGRFTWTVPNVSTTDAWVRIVPHDAAANTSDDVSDTSFTISDFAGPRDQIAEPDDPYPILSANPRQRVTSPLGDNVDTMSIHGYGTRIVAAKPFRSTARGDGFDRIGVRMASGDATGNTVARLVPEDLVGNRGKSLADSHVHSVNALAVSQRPELTSATPFRRVAHYARNEWFRHMLVQLSFTDSAFWLHGRHGHRSDATDADERATRIQPEQGVR